MIEGIEVLNQVEIVKTSGIFVFVTIASFLIVILGITTTLTSLLTLTRTDRKFFAFFGIIMIMIGAFGFVNGGVNTVQPTGKYEYQVTIDDTVSATTLYENYEVIDQQGKIWTIRLKEE